MCNFYVQFVENRDYYKHTCKNFTPNSVHVFKFANSQARKKHWRITLLKIKKSRNCSSLNRGTMAKIKRSDYERDWSWFECYSSLENEVATSWLWLSVTGPQRSWKVSNHFRQHSVIAKNFTDRKCPIELLFLVLYFFILSRCSTLFYALLCPIGQKVKIFLQSLSFFSISKSLVTG